MLIGTTLARPSYNSPRLDLVIRTVGLSGVFSFLRLRCSTTARERPEVVAVAVSIEPTFPCFVVVVVVVVVAAVVVVVVVVVIVAVVIVAYQRKTRTPNFLRIA